jgi:hypothetical protein
LSGRGDGSHERGCLGDDAVSRARVIRRSSCSMRRAEGRYTRTVQQKYLQRINRQRINLLKPQEIITWWCRGGDLECPLHHRISSSLILPQLEPTYVCSLIRSPLMFPVISVCWRYALTRSTHDAEDLHPIPITSVRI